MLDAVRTGKGDPQMYGVNSSDFVYLPALFGGIEPTTGFYQVTKGSPPQIASKGPIGTNNLDKAKAVQNIF